MQRGDFLTFDSIGWLDVVSTQTNRFEVGKKCIYLCFIVYSVYRVDQNNVKPSILPILSILSTGYARNLLIEWTFINLIGD